MREYGHGVIFVTIAAVITGLLFSEFPCRAQLRIDEVNLVMTNVELPKLSVGTEIAMRDGRKDYKKQRPHQAKQTWSKSKELALSFNSPRKLEPIWREGNNAILTTFRHFDM